jgi:hypothetical protein
MARKLTFTEDQKQAIISRYEVGEWAQTIAPDFSCSVGTLIDNLKTWGIEIRRRIPYVNLTPGQVKRMLQLYGEKKSLDEIALALSSTRVVVTRHLREQGAIIRRRGKKQRYFIVDGKKTCCQCGFTKNVTEFSLHADTHDGIQPACKECNNKRGKNQRLQRKFGITEAEYNEMLESQGGVCAICGQPETRTKFGKPTLLAVDHNHKTGKVRQLICFRCNVVIGRIEENPILCDKIRAYLVQHNGRHQ